MTIIHEVTSATYQLQVVCYSSLPSIEVQTRSDLLVKHDHALYNQRARMRADINNIPGVTGVAFRRYLIIINCSPMYSTDEIVRDVQGVLGKHAQYLELCP